MRFLRKEKQKQHLSHESHIDFSQLPAFGLQRKPPAEEPWNVSGEDTELRPLLPTSRLAPSSKNCQPACPEPNASPGSWVPEKTSGQGARRTGASHALFRISVSPSASEEAGLNGLKAHLASTWSTVLWCRRSSRGQYGHSLVLRQFCQVLEVYSFVNRL